MTERLRPFDFMVPFWGRQYREAFANLCLRSLLAPGNLPLLRAQDGHRFLVATTAEDWTAIEHLPVMDALRRHATPHWIDIAGTEIAPAASADGLARYAATIRRHTACLKRLFETAQRARNYGCLVFPDVLFSDGLVAGMLRWARAGRRLVLCPALRQAEEATLAELAQRGFASHGDDALVLPPRLVADLAVRHLHPEMTTFEEGNPAQPFLPPFRIWKVGQGQGMILHTFFGLPALMDYAAVPDDHAACLDEDAYENVYLGRNFSRCGGLYVVADSDELALLSLTPVTVNRSQAPSAGPSVPRWAADFDERSSIRGALDAYARQKSDTVRRDLFRAHVRWHGGDIDDAWRAEEARIAVTIARAAGDYYELADGPAPLRFPERPSHDRRFRRLDLALVGHYDVGRALYLRRRVILRRVGRVLRGDPAARHWLAWRLRVLGRQLRGLTDHPPAPDLPE